METILRSVAKDTEKLIRQLSLISFLMAQGRPVSALEIKREVLVGELSSPRGAALSRNAISRRSRCAAMRTGALGSP